MRLAIVVVAAALLAGCALSLGGTEWKKSDAMFQQVTGDEIECARTALGIGPGLDLVLGGLFDVVRTAVLEARQAGAFSACMTTRGYARVQ
jgi:hypothetical protein